MRNLNLVALRINIEKLLEEKKKNQSDLSLDSSIVSKILNGKRTPTIQQLEVLAQDLGVSVAELVDTKEYERFKRYLNEHENLYDMYHNDGQKLMRSSSKDIIEALGEEGLRSLVFNVLCGGNVRDITEFMTRNRLIISNAGIFKLLCDLEHEENNTDNYLDFLGKSLQLAGNDNHRLLPLWLMGLTKKGLDNIVRGRENLNDYTNKLTNTFEEVVPLLENNFGEIEGTISINGKEINVDWNFLNNLFTAIGAQTLTVRGSSKSMSGKLFEKLILGAALTLFGFEYRQEVPETIDPSQKLFWLSSSEEEEREIDATVVFNQKAVRIDIGFIGKGNPEIATDKMTRFRSESEIGKLDHLTKTIVIVDTIGTNSHMSSIAESIEGYAVEMKDELWIKHFSKYLDNCLGTGGILADLDDEEVHNWIEEGLESINLAQFVQKIDDEE
ncbi:MULTISPECIES: CfrBI family restriction endonuclease [Bacillus cereus group]|uniref:CfrBI family restriction endonuclease n=1 Tax=Bacillus cereus group TaxID=86661 RepID=UPI0013D52FBE|nr:MULTISPECIES: CfrBI family restriction endonuclease [Bacillus cereus group]MDK7433799.1 CfrBI family restriction endonuclease [Bacillus paranthracis]MDK7467598.1 CfrBI family restriction endonuclease [Bacillus paranthracis]MDK7483986.1 CfrBI family restriction endonuclease [Bacillus paranthracis]MDK7495388.1 CfrBI family restriction endonuclease [Bacillus paranthracis]MDK7498316.1 CfrBI family restriction endonuclease [Bacillus paranthracis]